MTRILDFNGHDADRTVTVAAISALKGSGHRFTQVTAGSADEAIAAEAADIEMAVCLAAAVADVRRGSSRLFVTAAIDFGGAVTLDDLLATAFQALRDGADASSARERPAVAPRSLLGFHVMAAVETAGRCRCRHLDRWCTAECPASPTRQQAGACSRFTARHGLTKFLGHSRVNSPATDRHRDRHRRRDHPRHHARR